MTDVEAKLIVLDAYLHIEIECPACKSKHWLIFSSEEDESTVLCECGLHYRIEIAVGGKRYDY